MSLHWFCFCCGKHLPVEERTSANAKIAARKVEDAAFKAAAMEAAARAAAKKAAWQSKKV